MIQRVNAPPLTFERTVREVLTAPLAQYGFECEETFPLYANEQVEFTRYRQNVKETVHVGRYVYDEDQLSTVDEEDEVDELRESGQGRFWRSRHLAYVQLVVNYGATDLSPDGRIGWSRTNEGLWRFTDAADLARRLREDALPHLLTSVMEYFDEELENQLDLIERGIEMPYRPPDPV
jgi:hypothetical protein